MEELKADQPANGNLLEKILDSLEFYLLIIFLALLPLSVTPFAYDFFNISKVTLIRLTGLLFLVSLSLKIIFNKKIKIPKSLLFYSVLGYFLLLAISSALSIHLPTSLLGLRKRYFGLLTYMPVFIIMYSVWIKKLSPDRQKTLILSLIGPATIISLIGILQALGSTFPMDLKSFFGSSAYSTIGNPNLLGIYLNLVLPLSLAMILSRKKILAKTAFVFSGVIIFVGILATNSSGSIFAAVAGLLLYAFLFFRKEINGPTHGRVSNIIILALFAVILLLFINVTAKSESASWQSRKAVWQASTKIIIENPLHGIGLDAMRFALPAVKDSYSQADKELFEDAHNIFLTTGVTAGIPALALFILAIFLFALKIKKITREGDGSYIYIAFSVSAFSYLLAEQVNPDHISALTLFWLFVAIIGSRQETFKQVKLPKLPALLFGLTLLFISFSLLILNNLPLMSEIQLLKAQQAKTISEAYSHYNKAQTYNPYYDIYWHNFAERLLPHIKSDGQEANFAIGTTSEAIRLSPLESDNYKLMGDIYKQLGTATTDPNHLKKAASYYLKALSLDRFNLDAMYDLAFTFEKIDRAKSLKTANMYLALEEDPQIRTLKNTLESK